MLTRCIIKSLIFVLILLSAKAVARVELIKLNYESNNIKIIVESRSPISFEYFTDGISKKFSVILEGEDFYPALTRYFQSIDIDSLSDCIDEITIVPISNNEARFEVRLADGLSASAYDDTSNSPRNFRVVIEFVAVGNGRSACFSGRSRDREIKTDPEFDVPLRRPINAAELEKAQGLNQSREKESSFREPRSRRSDTESKIKYEATLAYDALSYVNKGGLAGDEWLKQHAQSELRLVEVGLAGNYGSLEYQLRLLVENALNDESTFKQQASLYRASVGYASAQSTWKFSVGILGEPFGGDVSNNIMNLPFLEKSVTSNLAYEYNPGVMARFGDENFLSFDIGAFGKRPASSNPRSEQSITSRLLYTPFRMGEAALTVGLSVRQWEPVDNIYTISARPESHLLVPQLNVLQPNVDSVSTTGLSMFMNSGSLTMSIETVSSTLELDSTAAAGAVEEVSSRSLWGSWILTGESRRIYNGELQRVKPRNPFSFSGGSWGAFETGIRISQISDSTGKKLTMTGLAGAWYLNNVVQLKLSWVFFVQNVAAQESPGDNAIDNDADVIEIRVQVQY